MPLTEDELSSAQSYNQKVAEVLWKAASLPEPSLVAEDPASEAFAQLVANLQAEEEQHVDGKLGRRTLHALQVRQVAAEVALEQTRPLSLGWWTQGEPWPAAEAILATSPPTTEQTLDNYLRQHGVYHFNAYEFTRMHQWHRNIEPIRGDWHNIIPTARLAEILRYELGDDPLLVASGYRPRRYNKAVDGAPRSQHQTFRALLLQLHSTEGDDEASRRSLYEVAAKLYAHYGKALAMGLGFYRKDNDQRVSLDTGFRQRTWRADHVEQVLADLGLG